MGQRLEDTSVQYGKETNWGTAVTPTKAFKYFSEKLGQSHEDIKFPTSASRGALIAERAAGVLKYGGTVTQPLDDETIADILEMALGGRTTATGGTVNITVGNTIPSYSLYYNEGIDKRFILGAKVNSLEIKASMNEVIECTLEFDGKTGSTTNTIGALSASSTASSWVFHQGTFSFGATTLNVKSWSVKIANNLAVDFANSQSPIEILETIREVTGSVEVKLDTTMDGTINLAKLTQANAAMSIYATNASSKYFKLAFTNIRPEGEPPEFTKKAGEVTYMSFNFKAYMTDAATGEIAAYIS